MFNNKNSINGVTLIEFMLSLTMSLMIISAVTLIYLTAEKNLALQASLIEIQTNGQIAMQILRKAISTAGYADNLQLKYKIMGTEGTSFPLVSDTITIYQVDNNIPETNTYFVRATQRTSVQGTPIYALYRQDDQHHVFELIEGIDEMKINYDVNWYGQMITQTAEQVVDWSKVVGLNIMLAISSINGAALRKIWYCYVALK